MPLSELLHVLLAPSCRLHLDTIIFSPTGLDCQRCISACQVNASALKGRVHTVVSACRDPSARRSGLGNIFIKNLDKDIDHKALHDTFSAFGSILSCKVATDAADQSKGYGFVHFEKEGAAKLAIDKVGTVLMPLQPVRGCGLALCSCHCSLSKVAGQHRAHVFAVCQRLQASCFQCNGQVNYCTHFSSECCCWLDLLCCKQCTIPLVLQR